MGRTRDIASVGIVLSFRVLLTVVCLLLTVACTGWAKKSPPTVESQVQASAETPAEPAPVSPSEETAYFPDEKAKRIAKPAEQRPPPNQSENRGALAKLESAGEKPSTPVPESMQRDAEPVKPPLDLDGLETRLKETSAIGFFSKLALKNQVDDLLDKFRAFYQGSSRVTLAHLRQPYELLIMKVLALLQDSDPALARDILESREAIWGVLSDPDEFAALTQR